MSAKFANFRVILFLAVFGVYSVSSESFAYSNESSFGANSSRSNQDTPSPKTKKSKAQAHDDDSPPKSPFSPGSSNVSLGVGQDFLLGDLGDGYENSLGPEIHYDYGVSDMFAFDANFGYHSHSSGQLSIWNLSAGLRSNLMFFDQLVPFAIVGLGFYHPSQTLLNNASVSSLLFGLQMGGGIDLMLNKQLFFGTSLLYNDMFTSSKKDSNGVIQNLGGAFISFMIHLGFTY